MKYGAKGLRWAPFATSNPEPSAALPNYGTPIALGSLNKVTESVEWTDLSGEGDNVEVAKVHEFKRGSVDALITNLSTADGATIHGKTVDESDDVHDKDSDAAPFGGLAFYVTRIKDDATKVHQGIFYPKTKAELQGDEYSTKGALDYDKLKFGLNRCNTGDWRIKSEEFADEDDAVTWVTAKLPVPVTPPASGG